MSGISSHVARATSMTPTELSTLPSPSTPPATSTRLCDNTAHACLQARIQNSQSNPKSNLYILLDANIEIPQVQGGSNVRGKAFVARVAYVLYTSSLPCHYCSCSAAMQVKKRNLCQKPRPYEPTQYLQNLPHLARGSSPITVVFDSAVHFWEVTLNTSTVATVPSKGVHGILPLFFWWCNVDTDLVLATKKWYLWCHRRHRLRRGASRRSGLRARWAWPERRPTSLSPAPGFPQSRESGEG